MAAVAPAPTPAPAPSASAAAIVAGVAACEAGRLGEAEALFQGVLDHDPDDLGAAAGRARALLLAGRWAEAWPAFEVRFRLMRHPPQVTRRGPDGEPRPVPRWLSGAPPKSLLVLDEQGMGDTIQFLRFLPRLARLGTRLTLVTHPRLFHLVRSLGIDVSLRRMGEPGSVAGIDAWCPLLSIPGALGLAEADLAPDKPAYLAAGPPRIGIDLPGGSDLFRIGLCWQGNPEAPVDQGRSAPLAAFAPLAALDGVELVSLQSRHGLDQLDTVPFAARIRRPGPGFDAGEDAFVDTAALMARLDLVVSVDSAVAHLAGALGRPVFTALRRSQVDWRWGLEGTRTVWYPTMRLFRQPRPGDWWGAVMAMAGAVAPLVAAKRDRTRCAGRRGLMPELPVSVGELFDKLTILALKRRNITDPAALADVEREHGLLTARAATLPVDDAALDPLIGELAAVNATLWEVEDRLREAEAAARFDDGFVALARSVYRENDRRAAIKARINAAAGSALREAKSYAVSLSSSPASSS
jgi:hypothetical protein